MAVTYDQLMALSAPAKEFAYGDRECMLYALGVGFGHDPMDRDELPFVYERNLKTVPTLATVIGWDDDLILRSGLDLHTVVHGEQRVTLHQPIPARATVTSAQRVTAVYDKGPDRGALVLIENEIRDQASGAAIATNLSTVFARSDGGCGGPRDGGPAPHALPERPPDAVLDLKTRPDQALLYRLSGDRNPLHADPDFAGLGGFERPILHGLCTYGHACRAILKAMLDYQPDRIAAFEARFSAPVFPGETIRTEMWRDGDQISFRSVIPEREVVALNNGRVTLRP